MKKSITALKTDSRYGVELILCGNGEVLDVDATDLPYRRDEAVDMVLEAGGREATALGHDYSVDSTHSHWVGGWLGRGQHYMLASTRVAVRVYRLEPSEDYDGDTVYRWSYVTEPLPPFVVGEVAAIQSRIEDAMDAEIRRLETLAESIAANRADGD